MRFIFTFAAQITFTDAAFASIAGQGGVGNAATTINASQSGAQGHPGASLGTARTLKRLGRTSDRSRVARAQILGWPGRAKLSTCLTADGAFLTFPDINS
jgi:hypothetical protein